MKNKMLTIILLVLIVLMSGCSVVRGVARKTHEQFSKPVPHSCYENHYDVKGRYIGRTQVQCR